MTIWKRRRRAPERSGTGRTVLIRRKRAFRSGETRGAASPPEPGRGPSSGSGLATYLVPRLELWLPADIPPRTRLPKMFEKGAAGIGPRPSITNYFTQIRPNTRQGQIRSLTRTGTQSGRKAAKARQPSRPSPPIAERVQIPYPVWWRPGCGEKAAGLLLYCAGRVQASVCGGPGAVHLGLPRQAETQRPTKPSWAAMAGSGFISRPPPQPRGSVRQPRPRPGPGFRKRPPALKRRRGIARPRYLIPASPVSRARRFPLGGGHFASLSR